MAALNATVMEGKFDEVKFLGRSMFYLVTPSETTYKDWQEVPNYMLKYSAYAPLWVLLEVTLLWVQGKRLPRLNDSIVSYCCALLLLVPVIVLGSVEMSIYCWFYENFRLVDLPWNSWYTWVLCVFGVDLGFYAWHRIAHEVNFIWGFHQVHHTPEDFNMIVAGRLPCLNRYAAIFFYLPCAFFFPPGLFYAHYQLNYVFQVWIHTDALPSLGFLDYIINNPSLHRVHHARNRYCIDKNYGAVFSIWDVLFGTFEREKKDQTLYYGLVHPIRTWDSLYIQVHHFKHMWSKICDYDRISDKLSVIFKGPGWEPGKPRLGIYEEIPEVPEDKEVYDKKLPLLGYIYLLYHILIDLILYQMVSKTKQIYGVSRWYIPILQGLFVVWGVANTGYILEHKPFSALSEVARCAGYILLEMLIYEVLVITPTLHLILRMTFILSFIFWAFNQNMFKAEKTKSS